MSKANYTFYRPEKDGKGNALRVEMHYQTDEKPGFFRFIFADQKEEKFDLENGISADLDINVISEMLQVFRGETECVNEGKPMRIGDDKYFIMKHIIEDRSIGYVLAVCVKNGEDSIQKTFLLNNPSSLGLQLAIENSMFFLAFVKGVNP